MEVELNTMIPVSLLEPGRWTGERWLSCIMASGTKSWGAAEVVHNESLGRWHRKVPLFTVEMERAMCMPKGFTAMPRLSDKQRHHMIGNSFHVSVVAHIFRWLNLHQQAWDPHQNNQKAARTHRIPTGTSRSPSGRHLHLDVCIYKILHLDSGTQRQFFVVLGFMSVLVHSGRSIYE